MHASIALCVMMFGGVAYPDMPSDAITTLPLFYDPSPLDPRWEQERLDRLKHHPLPHVVTVDDRQPSADDSRYNKWPYRPNMQQQQNRPTGVMPQAPTQAGPPSQAPAGPYGSPPAQIGQGGSYGPGGAQPPGQVATRDDPYANMPIAGANPVARYNSRTNVPQVPQPPTASNYFNNNSVNSITSQYGLSNPSNGFNNPGAGGGVKPFSNYQPPSGYSPWQLLNQPTQNGTLNPYTNFVQPALSQQNFNAHVSEQINGVRTMQRGYGGASGPEISVGGNGLVNPQIFQNYLNYMPR
jgi:hypothetical protein